MRFFALLLAALVIPLAAACGGDENGGGAAEEGGAQTIEISATDFAFEPADISADPGEITFELTNDGDSPHALSIVGTNGDEDSGSILPGDSTTLTITAAEGTYEVYCPVGDHRDRGMEGTLTVGSGGGGGAGTTTDGETETEHSGTSTEHDETETEDDEDEDDSSGSGSGGY